MIRFKDKVFEEYFIDPETAVITDKDGNIKQQHHGKKGEYYYICIGRTAYNVHQIQAHTYLGYFKKCVVHHIDCDPSNNALSNLQLMTLQEHIQWHSLHRTAEWRAKNSKSQKGVKKAKKHIANLRLSHLGKKLTDDQKKKQSASLKKFYSLEENRRKNGERQKNLRWWTNGVVNTKSLTCPGEGWTCGRTKHK